jgi:hypothetical protein
LPRAFAVPLGEGKVESELITFLKGKYLTERTTTSSRSLELLQNSDDFQMYFNKIGYLVLPNNSFFVDTLIYPLSNNNFFFIRYGYLGDVINKKLPYSGNGVLLNSSELFSVDGNPISPSRVSNYQLFYFNGDEKKSYNLSNMDLVVVDEFIIKKEIEAILDISESPENQKAFIFQYLNFAYGNFDENAIQKIIESKN